MQRVPTFLANVLFCDANWQVGTASNAVSHIFYRQILAPRLCKHVAACVRIGMTQDICETLKVATADIVILGFTGPFSIVFVLLLLLFPLLDVAVPKPLEDFDKHVIEGQGGVAKEKT